MSPRQWILGLLNSALKQAAKLSLVVLAAYTSGQALDIKTLAYSISVGLVWGTAEWVYNNPIPDKSSAPKILNSLPILIDLKDK